MFGYVRTMDAELKVKEHELYRATYCGLCRSMGKCTGQCSRMTLNYDFVFLALTRYAISPCKVSFRARRCLAHPFIKRSSMEQNEILDYCSAASAILNYQKVLDDLNDEKGLKKLRAALLFPFVSYSRKKAIKKDPALRQLDESISKKLESLSMIEKSEQIGVDIPAACFGDILGEIMSFGLDGTDARIAFELGKHVGAWIYVADALDDMREDSKKGRYNPLLKLYGGRIPNGDELSLIYDATKNKLFAAESAFDLIDTDDEGIKNILSNILYIGIPKRTADIINSYSSKTTPKGKDK